MYSYLFSTLLYAVSVNVLTFLMFDMDEQRAESGGWRIPEARLLVFALIGGWIGAKVGQRRFRHKTRKQPFAAMLNAAGFVNLGAAIIIAFASFGGGGTIGTIAELWPKLAPATKERALPHRFWPVSSP